MTSGTFRGVLGLGQPCHAFCASAGYRVRREGRGPVRGGLLPAPRDLDLVVLPDTRQGPGGGDGGGPDRRLPRPQEPSTPLGGDTDAEIARLRAELIGQGREAGPWSLWWVMSAGGTLPGDDRPAPASDGAGDPGPQEAPTGVLQAVHPHGRQRAVADRRHPAHAR